MNSQLKQLVPAIVTAVSAKGGYVTKTKLLKLLYLFDVEYYRQFGKIYTGFRWKFLHLGPWVAEYDLLLNDLTANGALLASQSSSPDYEATYYYASGATEFRKIFPSYKEELPLQHVLNIWGNRNTSEILDHVYFNTEPMEHGVRNELLDFSHISTTAKEKYQRSSSGATPSEIAARRKKFARSLEGRLSPPPRFTFTPAKHDSEFVNAMNVLDEKND